MVHGAWSAQVKLVGFKFFPGVSKDGSAVASTRAIHVGGI
jgi:hypothetical protein